MTWFRRLRGGEDTTPAQATDDDSPEQLRHRLWARVQFVNAHAGRLPVAAVVAARDVTDTLREVVESAGDGELDIYAVVQVNGIVEDYLPTTLQAYLNLDPAVTARIGASGRTPQAALIEQLDALAVAADELLQASRAHDVDALESQGRFLQTKFTRSDLDL